MIIINDYSEIIPFSLDISSQYILCDGGGLNYFQGLPKEIRRKSPVYILHLLVLITGILPVFRRR